MALVPDAAVQQFLLETTHYKEAELKVLWTNYSKVASSGEDDGVIDRKEFSMMMLQDLCGRTAPAQVQNVFFEQLFRMFDDDRDGKITYKEFVTNLAVYSGKQKGDAREKATHKAKKLFAVYDVDEDNTISEKDLTTVLSSCLTDLSDIAMPPEVAAGFVAATLAHVSSQGPLTEKVYTEKFLQGGI